ncbi:MAG: energy-coupling factor ABC transporter permease [Wenzhouxiangella sp.]
MNLPAELLPLWLMLPAWLLLLGVLAWNLLGAPWRLLTLNGLWPLYGAACMLLVALWWMRISVHAGLELHLLGLTSMVLLFGWRLALVGGCLALMILALGSVYDWTALGLNGLLGVVLPVLLAQHLHALIRQWLPQHYFVYLMVAAHFSAMLVIAAVVAAGGLLMLLLGAQPWSRVGGDYLLFLPLIMVPEGFLNGALLTMLTLLKPEWVRSFDDRDYIDGK